MRLLKRSSSGSLTLEEFYGTDIPPYAILSHTWGPDKEEVSYQDVLQGTGKAKLGYRKLNFCAQQAATDHLEYWWIDTCCINKADLTELSEAINSMFRWYCNSRKCYVYLPDVTTTGPEISLATKRSWSEAFPTPRETRSTWLPMFKSSRWFTRGWTLQELLAPESVEFFSCEGVFLGTRTNLIDEIREITGIANEALQRAPLQQFSVEERFKWAHLRKTKKEEDVIYCLLGIFNVCMPLLYGEGRPSAEQRLRDTIRVAFERQEKSSREAVLWLSGLAPDPSINYEKALKARQPGTGAWYISSESYTRWRDTPGVTWIHGSPGCGKTVLSSTILESVLQHAAYQQSQSVAYFYFDFNDSQKQQPDLMLCSLIVQCQRWCNKIPEALKDLYETCGTGQRQPLLKALLEVLHQLLAQTVSTYIVIDALDESSNREDLLEILQVIATWQLPTLHILLTSRRERNIEDSLAKYVKTSDTISMQSSVVDRDIESFISHQIDQNVRLQKWRARPKLRKTIENTLVRKGNGMFLWVTCQLQSLEKCRTEREIVNALDTLPPTLDSFYDRILSSLEERDAKYAIRILRWLVNSREEILLAEIPDIVALDPHRSPAFRPEDVLEDPRDVLDICSTLIRIVEPSTQSRSRTPHKCGGPCVILSHYSVKEYLTSTRIHHGTCSRYAVESISCHNYIAKSCLHYLLRFGSSGAVFTGRNQFPLAYYCAKYWPYHVHAGRSFEDDEEVKRLVLELLVTDKNRLHTWLQLRSDLWDLSRIFGVTSANPICYAAETGLLSVVQELVRSFGADVNETCLDMYAVRRSTIYVALVEGYESTANWLIRQGAKLDIETAAEFDCPVVIQALLKTDRDARKQPNCANAFIMAYVIGHPRVVEVFLNEAIDVIRDRCGDALLHASSKGREGIVRTLLQKAHKQDLTYHLGHSVEAAALNGNICIAQRLLDYITGANLSASFRRILARAAEDGHNHTTELLLDSWTQSQSQRSVYNSATSAHSSISKPQLLRLDPDAHENTSQEINDRIAMTAACNRGRQQTVELLLARGADANVRDATWGSPLHTAAYRGHHRIVGLLLDSGVAINARYGDQGTPLDAATRGGKFNVARLLINRGGYSSRACPDRDAQGFSPLDA